MSKNILVVESHNDKYFIEALLANINKDSIIVENPICSINEYECLDGLSLEKLKRKLAEIQTVIEKNNIQKVGILVDADQVGIEARLSLVNKALYECGFTVDPLVFNSWQYCKKYEIHLSCHVLNCAGSGELETVLKAIKNQESVFADCLSTWQTCLNQQGKSLSTKDFDKFWINIYQRFDCCKKKESKQADRKCSLEASLKKPIWDWEHEILSTLKAYLHTF